MSIGCGGSADGVDGSDADDVVDADSNNTPDASDAPSDVTQPETRPGSITVLVGDSDRGHADGPGQRARFQGVTAPCHHDGYIYTSDTFAGTLRKVDVATGHTTTLAGVPGRLALSDGPAADARFASPRGLACLADGLLVADSGALRKVAWDGTTTTVAGFPGTAGNIDGDAGDARLGYLIHDMAVRPDGRVVFSDRSNDALREVDPTTWSVTTLVANLSGPGGVAIDPEAPDIAWVAETFADRLIRVDLTTGLFTPFMLDGLTLDTPQGLDVADGRAWVVGFGPDLLQVDLVTGRAQRLTRAFGGSFGSPVFVSGEDESRLIYAELERSALRQFALSSKVDLPLAGPTQPTGFVDGARDVARFGLLLGIARSGNTLLLADEYGLRRARVQRFAPDTGLEVDTLTPADEALLTGPTGVAVDEAAGILWVSQPVANRLWELDLASALGPSTKPTVISKIETSIEPAGLVIGPTGLLVAERGAHRITRWDGAVLVPFAGDGIRGNRDGPMAEARFDEPHALAFDADTKRLWVVELAGRLRLIDLASGLVSTVLLPGNGPIDGPVASARLSYPLGVLVAGDLFIFDGDPGSVRRLTFEAGVPAHLETVVGSSGLGGGLPPGPVFALDEAIVGTAAGGIRIDDRLLVIAEYALYLVDLGDAFDLEPEPNIPTPADCDFELTIGTGASTFEPLPESLVLERGTQGLQHIYVSLETSVDNLPAGLHPVTLALRTGSDETPKARMTLTVPWSSQASSRVVTGMVFVIEDPAPLLGVPLTLSATVTQAEATGCAVAPVTVRW
jgi:DNA-binding beta-propeller fold protein YncE